MTGFEDRVTISEENDPLLIDWDNFLTTGWNPLIILFEREREDGTHQFHWRFHSMRPGSENDPEWAAWWENQKAFITEMANKLIEGLSEK